MLFKAIVSSFSTDWRSHLSMAFRVPHKDLRNQPQQRREAPYLPGFSLDIRTAAT